MEMKNYIAFFVFCSCLLSRFHTLEFNTVGIYSICGDNFTQNNFTMYAYAMDHYFTREYQTREREIEAFYANVSRSYHSYDVCYNTTRLASVVKDLLLDPVFHVVNSSIVLEGRTAIHANNTRYIVYAKTNYYTIVADGSTNIHRIVTHIPENMFQTLLDLMSCEATLISKHSANLKTTSRMLNHDQFYNTEESFDQIIKYIKESKWKDIIVIRENINDIFTPAFNHITKLLSSLGDVCVKAITIENRNDSNRLIENVERMYLASGRTKDFILILVGPGKYDYFDATSDYFNKTVAIDLFKLDQAPFKWFIQFQHNERIITYFLDDARYMKIVLNIFNKSNPAYYIIHDNLSTFLTAFISTLDIGDGWRLMHYFYPERKTFKWRELHEWTLVHFLFTNEYSFFDSQNKTFHSFSRNFQPTLFESKCDQPRCGQGFEKVFTRYSPEETAWDAEFGYTCRPCRPKHWKSSSADVPCEKCSGYFVANSARTTCIDPLSEIYHRPQNLSGVFILLFCVFGAIMCFTGIFIFISYRKTLIVKTSDLTMSLVHLHAILLFFLASSTLYFMRPATEICIARTVSIAVLYNLNISIILTKSNKLVKAFSSKVRSTKSEVLITSLTQVATIVTYLVIPCLVIAAQWFQQRVEASIRLEIEHRRKVLYCNNGNQNIIISGLMLLYQLDCFVQAFRCRKLPGHINEAMSTVYVIFIASTSLCVMFPIYFFQELPENGELVLALVLTGNNLILFLFMYGRKMFIILCRPQKNTKAYFRRKQMEMINKKAGNI